MKQRSEQKEKGEGFIRKAVTIPADLASFADERAAQPEHAGNLSSYFRSLIIKDRAGRDGRKQVA